MLETELSPLLRFPDAFAHPPPRCVRRVVGLDALTQATRLAQLRRRAHNSSHRQEYLEGTVST